MLSHEPSGKWDNTKGSACQSLLHCSKGQVCTTADKRIYIVSFQICSDLLYFALFTQLKASYRQVIIIIFFFFVYKQPLNNGQVRKRNILKCSNLRWLSSVHIQDSTILIYECLSRYSNFLTYFEHLNSIKIKYSLHNQKGTLCSLCNSESPLNSLPQVKFLLKRKPGDSCIASLHYFYLTANTINHCIKTVQHYT